MPTPPVGDRGSAELVTSSYRLASGDRVRVTVFRHEDLSGEFALDGAGNFAMPLVGEIQAYGLTTRELESRLQEKLSDGYLVEPQVSVEVLNYRPFYILGEVRAPGRLSLRQRHDRAQRGGAGRRLQLPRQAGRIPAAAWRQQLPAAPRSHGDSALLPGDIVTVQERFF